MALQPLSGTQDIPLLRNKLYIPTNRREQVRRPRLTARLEAGLSGKLTLISAPAGFGKTTLLSTWAHRRAPAHPVAWLSLDADDSEPLRFWRYFVAALQAVESAIGHGAQDALYAPQPGPLDPRPLVAALINDLTARSPARAAPDPYVLVLDDYHLIEGNAVHESLDYLLDHLPPSLHLVITTREDPPFALSRLRGRGYLSEIRAADLCFTVAETVQFLNAVMDLDLSPGEIAALDRRTEGWIVGLQMAALSLQGRAPAERRGEFGLIERWLETVPEAIIRARALLCMLNAWATLVPGPTASATRWMARARELSAANPRPLEDRDAPYDTDCALIAVIAAVFEVRVALRRGELAEAARLALALRDSIPPEDTFWSALCLLYLADAYEHMDDGAAAERTLAEARALDRETDAPLVARIVASAHARNAWDMGDLHAAARICRQMIQTMIAPAESTERRVPGACIAYVYLGRVLLEWNDLRQAEAYLLRGIDLAYEAGENELYANGCRDMAWIRRLQGRYAEAHEWIDRAVALGEGGADYLSALRARIWLAQAADEPRWLDEAVRWAAGRPLVDPDEYSHELQSLARVRIAQYRAYSAPDLGPVLDVLDEHYHSGLPRSSGWTVQSLILIALAYQALDALDEAMPPLAHALSLGRETGRALAFLEHGPPMLALLREAARRSIEAPFVRQLLDAFHDLPDVRRKTAPVVPLRAGSDPVHAELVEPLTERELDVLRLLATTLSGPEIADELVFSVNTLRSHTKSIYGKLGVHSRLDAVARASELGLLPE